VGARAASRGLFRVVRVSDTAVWTVPVADQGSNASVVVFRHSFYERLAERAARFHYVSIAFGTNEAIPRIDDSKAGVRYPTVESGDSHYEVEVSGRGEIQSSWYSPENTSRGSSIAHALVKAVLPTHAEILEDLAH
jgi:hypothetical protein